MSGLTNLTTLYLYNSQISSLSPLSGLTNLAELWLDNNQISNLSPLSGLTNLTTLSLSYNQISSLSPLSGLTNLTTLNLENNQISNLSPLSGLTNLTTLNLDNNQISNLSPLSGLTNLINLLLRDNQISSLSPLSGLTNLTTLYLYNNQISSLSPLSGLTNLAELWLDNNQISNLSPLSGLTNLTTLSLSYNQISSLSPLSGLTNLTTLNLENNQISDVRPLTGPTRLGWLDLRENPLNQDACSIYIPQICANNPGINIWYDPCVTRRTLTISVSAGGYVATPGEGTYLYDDGTNVAIVAQANGGYEFTGWTGTAVDAGKVANPSSASTTVLMDADYTLVANFEVESTPKPKHNLSISSTAGGKVMVPGQGIFQCDEGTVLWVSAAANDGFAFSIWTGTAADAGKVADTHSASTSVTLDADYTLVANFTSTQAQTKYTLKISSSEGGYVSPLSDGTYVYDKGATVRLQANPNPGYHFVSWSGTTSSTDNPIVVTMNQNQQVKANFSAKGRPSQTRRRTSTR